MKYQVNRVAILGAGVMGASIAAHFAGAGFEVLLLDVLPSELTTEEKAKGLTLEDKAVRNRFANSGKERILNPRSRAIYSKTFGNQIETGNFTDDLPKISSCELILEVIVENLAIKQTFMKDIAKYRSPGSIVATNTSGVSVNEIVANMDKEFKEHFMGTHFFNPPRFMKLFELIPANDTKPDLIDWMVEFAEKRLGKGVVVAKDTPNFIANRIGVQALASVMKITEEYEYSIPEADLLTGAIIGRPKTGTFRLADMVGIDILVHVAGNVFSKTDDPYEIKSNTIPYYVEKMVEKGYLGDKSKGGFYKKSVTAEGQKKLVWDYFNNEYTPLTSVNFEAVSSAKKKPTLAEKIHNMAWGEQKENQYVWEVLKSTLLYAANNVPEISDDYKSIDQAMKWGFNWDLGPFEVWDALGFKASADRMVSEGETLPTWIIERSKQNLDKFYRQDDQKKSYIWLKDSNRYQLIIENDSAALIDIGDGVACLEFRTPNNTINNGLNEMLFQSIKIVEEGEYKGLVIANHGKNFSPGANLKVIAEMAKAKEWNKIEALAYGLQYGGMALKYAKKPVVVSAHGMTLGGGAEIAMSGYRQVLHVETYMGLVELGVGLIPAGGGTKEMLWRYASNLEKSSQLDRVNHVKKAWDTIIMGKVSSSAYDAMERKYVNPDDRVVMNQDYLIDEAKKEVIYLYDSGFRPKVKRDIVVAGIDGRTVLEHTSSSMKEGNFISAYDAYLANKVAYVLTGGDVVAGSTISEDRVLELEREVFISLCGEQKTIDRMDHMLNKGRLLKN